jgi:hydrophobe/amphiphile efflux-1 (HAE1) family protein
MNLPKLSVQNPIGVSMLFIAILVIGTLAFRFLPRDVMPDIDFPTLTVVTVYPGASPEDVEKDVTAIIEIVLASTPNLRQIQSVSRENVSIITLQFQWESDVTEAANNARDLLEVIKNDLPASSEPPFIMKVNSAMLPVAALTVSAKESYDDFDNLYNTIIAPRLRRIQGVGTVFPIANPEKQLFIEVDPELLMAYNLSIQQITTAIQTQKISIPGGNIKIDTYDLSVRLPSLVQTVEDIENVTLTYFNNKHIRIKDVAKVREGFKEKEEVVRNQGQRGIALFIQKQTGTNTLETYEALVLELEEIKTLLPSDVQVDEIFNTADIITITLKNLGSTVWWGSVWVVLVVFLFLRHIRSSLIIILTIPFSLIIAFIVIYIFDYTINIFSLMSLVVAMGMVVDNAIVVLENITKHTQKGVRIKEASVFGTREMGLAITASTFTTIAVFMPMLFVGGIVGIMFKQLVVITIATLLASLFTALTLTPMLSSRLLGKQKKQKNKLYVWSEKLFEKTEQFYKSTLAWAIFHKTITIIIALLVFGASLYLTRFIGSDYLPDFDTGDVLLAIETEEGMSVAETEKIAVYVESLIEAHVPEKVSTYIIGGQTEKGLLSSVGFSEGKNFATIGIRLTNPEERSRNSKQIALSLEEILDTIPQVSKYQVSGGSILSAIVLGNAKPIEIKLFGNDLDLLEKTAYSITTEMHKQPYLVGIETPSSRNKPEILVTIDKEKASALGLNNLMIAMQVRQGLYGSSAGSIFVNNENKEIIIRYPEEYRNDIRKLNQISLNTMYGKQVSLGSIASIQTGSGYQEIQREGQQRVYTISAQTKDISLGDAGARVEQMMSNIDIDPAVDVQMGGQLSEQTESFESLGIALIIGVMLVFMIMASLFRSLIHPFIIILSVPFTLTGVIVAFLLSGLSLSVVTFTGFIMLMGIVVNNGIVLVDYTNLLRARGLSLSDAVQEAGKSRLRPVLMTTMTTVLAMVPMAMSKTMGYEVWSPLGITMIGGLLVSTFITLILVPVLYATMEAKKLNREISNN